MHPDDEAWIPGAVEAWRQQHAEEGAPIIEHARRVVGGLKAGHWCEPFAEQREAAKRFLATLPVEVRDGT